MYQKIIYFALYNVLWIRLIIAILIIYFYSTHWFTRSCFRKIDQLLPRAWLIVFIYLFSMFCVPYNFYKNILNNPFLFIILSEIHEWCILYITHIIVVWYTFFTCFIKVSKVSFFKDDTFQISIHLQNAFVRLVLIGIIFSCT